MTVVFLFEKLIAAMVRAAGCRKIKLKNFVMTAYCIVPSTVLLK
jgi:hypothetical protein